MHTYEYRVYRDGRWWMIEIPQLGGLTQTRRIADVQKEATDWIALEVGIAPSQIHLVLTGVRVNDIDVLARERQLEELSQQVKALEAQRAAQAAAIARDLAEEDVPMRDIGEVLHVSHQRAHQLIHG
jgi:hypothetical protein